MEWNETCETCPMFEPATKPDGYPADQEFRLGACNGAPDIVCMHPVPAPPQVQKRVIAAPNDPPAMQMMLVPETFRRLVDSNRRACSIHPKWSVYVAVVTSDAMMQATEDFAARQALRQADPQGNA